MEIQQLFKLQYKKAKVWCRIKEVTYSAVLETIRNKFPLVGSGAISLYDKDDVLIDEEFIEQFFSMEGDKTIIIKDNSEPDRENDLNMNNVSISTTDTDTLTNLSVLSDDNNYILIEDHRPNTLGNEDIHSSLNLSLMQSPATSSILMPPPSLKKFGNIQAEELKAQILAKHNDSDIFEEYKTMGCLTTQTRKCLVNIICDLMVERYGINNIPTKIKEEYAKCIIDIFPKLRDPFSAKGYEAFFNSQKHDGFLAWRLKTLARNNSENKRKRIEKEKSKNIKKQKMNEEEILVEMNEDIIEDLKAANPIKDTKMIFTKMAETFQMRRKRPMENILIDFPRFIDTPGLIEQEFSLMFPNKPTLSERFIQYCDKIVDIYKQSTSNTKEDIENSSKAWVKEIRTLLLLIQLLPPTAKGRRAPNKDTKLSAIEKFIEFKKVNTTFTDIFKKCSKQPFLIGEGQDYNDIRQFHIYVDEKLISLRKDIAVLEAVDILFMSHFVFNIEYEPALSNFYTFLQVFFYEIDSEHVTPKIRELRAKLQI